MQSRGEGCWGCRLSGVGGKDLRAVVEVGDMRGVEVVGSIVGVDCRPVGAAVGK